MKLIGCCITENEENWLPLSLESYIKHIDKLIIVDSGSKDCTIKIAQGKCEKYKKEFVLLNYKRNWQPDDDGKQRNAYVNYLKENHIGDWAIVLDADEVIKGNLDAIKDNFNNYEREGIDCLNINTEHLIGDLGHVDRTVKEHWTLRRIFKITNEIYHPTTEHGMIQGIKKAAHINKNLLQLWHFAHARHIFYWLNKHLEMRDKSNIHSKDFQEWWYYSHLLGRYPKEEVYDLDRLPEVIKDNFLVLNDLERWKTKPKRIREEEQTSSDMAFKYAQDFISNKIKQQERNKVNILDVGAKDGYYVDCWKSLGYNCMGMDIVQNDKVVIKGKMEDIPVWDNRVDCVFCSHVFEHTVNPIKTLNEFNRVMKPNSILILIFPHYCDREIFAMDKQHNFIFTYEQMQSLLQKNSFRVLDFKTFKKDEKDEVTWSNLIIAANV